MRFGAAWLAVGLLSLPGAAGAELDSAEEIDACFKGNFPDDTSVQTVSMNAKDRIGAVTSSNATIHWKRFDGDKSKVLMRFSKPAEMRGAGMLMVQKEDRNDMFMYLPALAKVRRVSKHMTSSSMFGTDFSFEEFERLQGIADDAPSERQADAEVQGRPAYVVEARPEPESDSAYERIRSWIDKETCVVLRAEFFESGEEPRKVMTAAWKNVAEVQGVWLAREILMQDRRDDTETTMIVEEVDVGTEIPRKMFSERELVQGGR